MTWFQLIRRFWNPAQLPQRPQRPMVPQVPTSALVVDLLERHNAARLKVGLTAFTLSASLVNEAQAWAEHMAATGELAHSQIGRLMMDHGAVAENIASGQPTTSHVMMAWLASTGHRANILGRYRVAGFGECGGFWCALFGDHG